MYQINMLYTLNYTMLYVKYNTLLDHGILFYQFLTFFPSYPMPGCLFNLAKGLSL